MNIVRHIRPNGAPIIVQAHLDDEGEVIRETVKLYPIIIPPTNCETVGDEMKTVETTPSELDNYRNNQPPYPYNEIS